MTRDQWLEIAAGIVAKWPHRPLARATLAQWFADLQDLDGDHVRLAVEVLYREGREYPPNGAQVRGKVAELAVAAPSWEEAWQLLLRAVRRFGQNREDHAVEWLRAEAGDVMAALPGTIGWRRFCLSEDGDTSVHAQTRNAYQGLVRRARRPVELGGLPVPAALPGMRRELRGIGEALKQITAPAAQAVEDAA